MTHAIVPRSEVMAGWAAGLTTAQIIEKYERRIKSGNTEFPEGHAEFAERINRETREADTAAEAAFRKELGH